MNPTRSTGSISPARRAAFDILHRVEADAAYASVLIAGLDQADLSPQDRALVQELTLGVLRRRGTLDYFIERYAERSVSDLALPVLIALRLGLYQLAYLTRIPQSAAVNESVNLVKRARVTSAAGLVNAVLRRAARNRDAKPGEGIADSLDQSSAELSHPRWMLESWNEWLGADQTRQLALANNSPPRTAFRINALHPDGGQALKALEAEGVVVRESSFVPGAFVVEGGPAGALQEAARQGLIYLEDEASQLVSFLVGARPGDRVLDVCAAPGSKCSHIAALTGDEAWIVAGDLHPRRVKTLQSTLRQLGVRNAAALALDATQPPPFLDNAPRFDRVLVDAPCSGTGTLRGNPEIKWRLSASDLPRLAHLQLTLLGRAAALVAVDGRMVYSTCSIEPVENEDVVRRFLGRASQFRAVAPEAGAGVITSDGFVRTFPHTHGSDGFFAAVLKRVI